MSEKRPWATKSAAHRIGLVPCPQCNPEGKAVSEITIACAWCWDGSIGEHTRFIPVDKAIQWATAHGLDVADIPTPAEHRGAIAPTDPAPPSTDPAPILIDADPDSER
jgi:hypothetical protein